MTLFIKSAHARGRCEELLIELTLLRLGTDGAAAIEVGGDIVRSAVGAPGKLTKALYAKASSNGANKAMKRRNPTLEGDSPNIFQKKNFLNFEVGVGVSFFICDAATK